MTEREVQLIVIDTIALIVISGFVACVLVFLLAKSIELYSEWGWKRYRKQEREKWIGKSNREDA